MNPYLLSGYLAELGCGDCNLNPSLPVPRRCGADVESDLMGAGSLDLKTIWHLASGFSLKAIGPRGILALPGPATVGNLHFGSWRQNSSGSGHQERKGRQETASGTKRYVAPSFLITLTFSFQESPLDVLSSKNGTASQYFHPMSPLLRRICRDAKPSYCPRTNSTGAPRPQYEKTKEARTCQASLTNNKLFSVSKPRSKYPVKSDAFRL